MMSFFSRYFNVKEALRLEREEIIVIIETIINDYDSEIYSVEAREILNRIKERLV